MTNAVKGAIPAVITRQAMRTGVTPPQPNALIMTSPKLKPPKVISQAPSGHQNGFISLQRRVLPGAATVFGLENKVTLENQLGPRRAHVMFQDSLSLPVHFLESVNKRARGEQLRTWNY